MTSKLCEIETKAWWLSYKALADKAKEIYNNGNLQIPQTETQIKYYIFYILFLLLLINAR